MCMQWRREGEEETEKKRASGKCEWGVRSERGVRRGRETLSGRGRGERGGFVLGAATKGGAF